MRHLKQQEATYENLSQSSCDFPKLRSKAPAAKTLKDSKVPSRGPSVALSQRPILLASGNKVKVNGGGGLFGDANKVSGGKRHLHGETEGHIILTATFCQTNLSSKLVYGVIPFQRLLWQKRDIILLEWLAERAESQSDSYFISATETSSV